MKKSLKERIEKHVDDWHWDEDSKKNAFELGKFLFSFIDYLEDQKLSERTMRKHLDNLYIIGHFESGYGLNDVFEPSNLENGSRYLYEYERKVSDSKYAIQSYESTWRKLEKYIESKTYEKYMIRLEEKLEQG